MKADSRNAAEVRERMRRPRKARSRRPGAPAKRALGDEQLVDCVTKLYCFTRSPGADAHNVI